MRPFKIRLSVLRSVDLLKDQFSGVRCRVLEHGIPMYLPVETVIGKSISHPMIKRESQPRSSL